MKLPIIFIIALCFSFPSFAMMCMEEKVKTRFKAADFVFEATVKERVKLDEEDGGICWVEGDTCGSKIATVEIGEVWKGAFDSNETTVYSEDACYCLGTYFPIGVRYVIFGKVSDNEGYEVRDMGACWTESYEYIENKTLKKLTKLKKKANKASQAGTQ